MSNRVAKVALVAVAILGLGSARSFALTLGPTFVSSATVTVGGTPTLNLSIDLRDVSNPLTDTNPAQITWSGANAGGFWKIADQCMLMTATVTYGTGGVQILTNNKIADGTFQYSGVGNPAGLVSASGTQALSMAWSLKLTTATVGTTVLPQDPNAGDTTGFDNSAQWTFMQDRDTSGFTEGQTASSLIKPSDGGAQLFQFTFFPYTNPMFLYFEANFAAATAATTYGTNNLVVQGYIL